MFFYISYPSVYAFLQACKSVLFLFGLESSWRVFHLEIFAYRTVLIVSRLYSSQKILSPQADKTIVRESLQQDAV